ncbi:hypothetical protein HDV03_003948 [Kappamyces sp. JEL0829]|nr:hypothetical protein HDV03_003948 [Kappamyces sp. JEL0829]
MVQKVYFGKLARDTREDDLEKLLRKYGKFSNLRVLQGFAFVEFDDSRDADDAVKDLDGIDFMGERICVEFAKARRDDRDRRDYDRRDDRDRGRDRYDDRRDDRRRRSPVKNFALRVAILGLPSRTTWQDLKDLMRKAGEVQYTSVDDRSGDGVVEFRDQEGKDKALEMFSGYDYNGSSLTIKDTGSV